MRAFLGGSSSNLPSHILHMPLVVKKQRHDAADGAPVNMQNVKGESKNLKWLTFQKEERGEITQVVPRWKFPGFSAKTDH